MRKETRGTLKLMLGLCMICR